MITQLSAPTSNSAASTGATCISAVTLAEAAARTGLADSAEELAAVLSLGLSDVVDLAAFAGDTVDSLPDDRFTVLG